MARGDKTRRIIQEAAEVLRERIEDEVQARMGGEALEKITHALLGLVKGEK